MSRGSATSRHPGDAVRVFVGIVVLLVACLAVQRNQLTRFEADIFRLINDLPSTIEPVLVSIMQAGNVVAAPILGVVLVAFSRRRFRVAVDVSVAGAVAWLAAKAVKSVVERPRPTGFLTEVFRFDHPGGLGFVSGHTAVAAAIATAAAPYLPRRWRRAIWLLPWTVGFARVYVGAHLPFDIVGGAALGWVVGASAHLLLGAPHGVPTLDDAARVIRRGAAEPLDVERVAGSARGSFPFTAVTTEGRIFIKLLDPEPRDRDWIYRAARFLAFRDVRDEAAILDAPAQAYREAAMTLLARSCGARVPAVRAIERDWERVWIIQDHVAGRDLAHVAPSDVTDPMLRDLWRQLELLRASRLAHRDLVASNVLLDEAGDLWLVDLAHATTSASATALDNDAAELLATTSLLVGPDRAVTAAVDTLGRDGAIGALAELQPLTLTPESRHALAEDPTHLTRLQRALETAIGNQSDVVDDPPYELRALRTVAVVAAAVLLSGALVAVAGPREVAEELTTRSLRWLGLSAIAAAVATVAAASALVAASGRRLAIGRTALVQQHAVARSVLAGTASGGEVIERYLSRSGVRPGEALAGLARLRRSRWMLSGLAVTAAIVAAWEEGVRFQVAPKLAALAGVAMGAAALQWLLADRRRSARPSTDRRTGRFDAPMLLIGVGITTAAEVATAVAVVSAFGPGPAAGVVIVVAAVASTTRAFSASRAFGPESALIVAGLATAGMALPAAVAAALVLDLLQTWIPTVVGRLLPGALRAAVAR